MQFEGKIAVTGREHGRVKLWRTAAATVTLFLASCAPADSASVSSHSTEPATARTGQSSPRANRI